MRKSLSQSAVSNTGLHESIEQLYAALEKYPLNCKMNGSPLYHDLARWNQVLSAKSLRNLSVDDLRIYYFKAMTTWGDINDFKHFLPRIFELLSELPVDLRWSSEPGEN